MIKLINIITQNIILLGCCAISIFILFVLITFIKNVDDFAAITNMYDYIRMQNIKSRKAYKEISTLKLTNMCAVRACDDRSSCAYYKPCADISMCKICFLNANNYLNVLKYIKHNKNKFPLTSTL